MYVCDMYVMCVFIMYVYSAILGDLELVILSRFAKIGMSPEIILGGGWVSFADHRYLYFCRNFSFQWKIQEYNTVLFWTRFDEHM